MNQAQSQYETSRERRVGPASMQSMQPTQDLLQYLKEYARQKPEATALWCFGIGFVLGWKLKPW